MLSVTVKAFVDQLKRQAAVSCLKIKDVTHLYHENAACIFDYSYSQWFTQIVAILDALL